MTLESRGSRCVARMQLHFRCSGCSRHSRPVSAQFCVYIVLDGREKMSASVKKYLEETLHLWDEEMLLKTHHGSDVTCHIFQRTVIMRRPGTDGDVFLPLQIVLAVKEKNGGKLNSHLWFFRGLAAQAAPDFLVVRFSRVA